VKKYIIILFIILGWTMNIHCQNDRRYNEIPIEWTELDIFSHPISSSVKIYHGVNEILPLHVWVASVNTTDSSLSVDIVAADDEDKRETLSQISQQYGALIAINGGYFRMKQDPTSHVGLLMEDHKIISSPIRSLIYDDKRYFTARGALGVSTKGTVDVAWVTENNDSLFEWKEPVANLKGKPHKPLNISEAIPWVMEDALQAGPVLIAGGKIHVTVNEEVFFHSTIPNIHPRTAAGITEDGRLILMVVDGRQMRSRGVYLDELALMMHGLGCIEAINLDGGGSSAMVVDGVLLNRPSGGMTQREVMSAITVSRRE